MNRNTTVKFKGQHKDITQHKAYAAIVIKQILAKSSNTAINGPSESNGRHIIPTPVLITSKIECYHNGKGLTHIFSVFFF